MQYTVGALLINRAVAEWALWPEIVPTSNRCLDITMRFDTDVTRAVSCDVSTPGGGFDTDWRPYHQDLLASESVQIGSNRTRVCMSEAAPAMNTKPGTMNLRCRLDHRPDAVPCTVSWHPLRQHMREARGAEGAFVTLWAVSAAVPRVAQMTAVGRCVRVRAEWETARRGDLDFCELNGRMGTRPLGADAMATRGGYLYTSTRAAATADGDLGPPDQEIKTRTRRSIGQRLRRLREIGQSMLRKRPGR